MAQDVLERLLGPLEELAERHGLSEACQADLMRLVLSTSGRGDDTWTEPQSRVQDEDLGQSWARAMSEALEAVETPALREPAPDRYEDLGLIGQGGMGEVRRMRDTELNRQIAIKALRRDVKHVGPVRRRFLEEAQVTAQLQHPGVVPVHELGLMHDGRPYFTMPVVRGRTLGQILREVHSTGGHSSGRRGSWSLRRLVDTFQKACETVAYAHSRGVVHRDLKPDNIMVGSFGEVFVMDWGLAKVLGGDDSALDPLPEHGPQEEPAITLTESMGPSTEFGAVVGTPAYMALEQAQGWLDQIGPHTDVFALGAILHTIISGRPPYTGDGREVVLAVRKGPPTLALEQPGVPPELSQICRKALGRRPSQRYGHAGELAEAVLAWLDSAHKRDQALALVAQAEALRPQVEVLRKQADEHAARAEALRLSLPDHAGVEQKRPLWAEEDEATRLEGESEFRALERLHLLRAALNHVPDMPEANALLAEHYRTQHAAAEARRDHAAIRQWELLLRGHDQGPLAAYLKGDGSLTLRTEPAGASARLYRFEEHDRRLLPVPMQELGSKPLQGIVLPMGSYLLRLQAPDCHEVLYPFALRRMELWDAVPPGGSESVPVCLPPLGSLGPLDAYVPGGWTTIGGDPFAPSGLPERRVWVDSFVMRKQRVTNADWLLYLNTLVAEGREAEALAAVPREPGTPGTPVYGRDGEGHFVLIPDKDGDLWHPDWPVLLISWEQSRAYAAWLSAREGLPWRLPTELEWEKAGRGVDGRFFPWGDHFDHSFCNIQRSRPGKALPGPAGEFVADCSVYGVMDMAGGAREWCLELESGRDSRPVQPRLDGARALVPAPWTGPLDDLLTVTRGGSWMSTPANARLVNRAQVRPSARSEAIGLRLVRSWEG